MFYMLYAQAEQEYQQPQNFTFNFPTGSDLHQDNNTRQQADHKSDLQTYVNSTKNKTNKQLEPTVSTLNYTAKNGAKALLLVTGAKALPSWVTAAYLANRLIIFNYLIETPFVETATQEEAEELAAQGKYKVPEPIVFPIAHHVYKYCEKKIRS